MRLLLLVVLGTVCSADAAAQENLSDTLKTIEERLDARLGAAVLDDETGRSWQYNADQRFPMMSTFKTLACAALLFQVDAGQEQLERVVTFDESDLVDYSPITENRTGPDGMTLGELCEATMSVSDNSAANFVLDAIGGQKKFNAFVRSIGDEFTRLDRRETELNAATPGDKRDTTTPHAMLMTLRALTLDSTLSRESRAQLTDWLSGNLVSAALFRAGVPGDWKVGDRTGAGGYGSRAIAAIMWPPGRSPVFATVYITETESSFDERNAAIAEIGRAIAAAVTEQ